MTPKYLLDNVERKNAGSGSVVIVSDWERLEVGSKLVRKILIKLTRVGSPRMVLQRFPFQKLWIYFVFKKDSLSESFRPTTKEVERLAASYFTPRSPVHHVSDVAIAQARRIISDAQA